MNPFQDVMSALLAIGSPMLITYSMILSLLLKRHVRNRFRRLIRVSERSKSEHRDKKIVKRLRCARAVVEEASQTPMRLSNSNGWLMSLVCLKENQQWWEAVRDRLYDTRRSITASLVFQLLFAVVSWMLTVIAAAQSLGQLSTSNAIATSTVWMWLLPVVIGWVSLGTQYTSGTVDKALNGTNLINIRIAKDTDGDWKLIEGTQEALLVATGLPFQTSFDTSGRTTDLEMRPQSSSETQLNENVTFRSPSIQADSNTELITSPSFINPTTIPTLWGFDLSGGEGYEGPIYNYARGFTYTAFLNNICSAFEYHLLDSPAPGSLPWKFLLTSPYQPFSQVSSSLWRSIV